MKFQSGTPRLRVAFLRVRDTTRKKARTTKTYSVPEKVVFQGSSGLQPNTFLGIFIRQKQAEVVS